jgi:hypothetical protein
MREVIKPATRSFAFHIVICTHVAAVLVFVVFAVLDLYGMGSTDGPVSHAVAALIVWPAFIAFFVGPIAFLIVALRRGWRPDTALALLAEAALFVIHGFAISILCR